jgi:hypothetical protein
VAIASVLGTLSRRYDCYYERGIASCDKGDLRRAARELYVEAPSSAHSAMGPDQACSARCRAAKMILAKRRRLKRQGRPPSSCPRALSSVAHIGAFVHVAIASVLGTLSRRYDCYYERGIASCDKGDLRRAARELYVEAPTSAHSAMGPDQACSARCRAVKMVLLARHRFVLRATTASGFELRVSRDFGL